MEDNDISNDAHHLESDISVRHGTLRVKVFEEKFDVGAPLSPVSKSNTLQDQNMV